MQLPFRLSKKLAAYLLTTVAVAFNRKLGLNLTEAEVTGLVAVTIAYLAGQGYIDATEAKSLKQGAPDGGGGGSLPAPSTEGRQGGTP